MAGLREAIKRLEERMREFEERFGAAQAKPIAPLEPPAPSQAKPLRKGRS